MPALGASSPPLARLHALVPRESPTILSVQKEANGLRRSRSRSAFSGDTHPCQSRPTLSKAVSSRKCPGGEGLSREALVGAVLPLVEYVPRSPTMYKVSDIPNRPNTRLRVGPMHQPTLGTALLKS